MRTVIDFAFDSTGSSSDWMIIGLPDLLWIKSSKQDKSLIWLN